MTNLPKLLYGEGAFARVEHIFEGMTLEHVSSRPQHAPHSIYQELWHIVYWQRLMLAWARGEKSPAPRHASEGWPEKGPASEAEWQALVAEFLEGIKRAGDIAANPAHLDEAINERYTVRQPLESLVAHNAYHFGRIVFLRQLLGSWPPPSGGDTW